MNSSDQVVAALRKAVKLAPDNYALRQHLADTLGLYGYWAEAETEYRRVLAADPENGAATTGLAKAFFQQGKNASALVVVEEILKLRGDNLADGYILHAKLLAGGGDVEGAVRQYKKGIALDPSTADNAFVERYNVHPGAEDDNSNDEIVEGKLRAPAADSGQMETGGRIERPRITFADVGGLDTLKEEISVKIIHPLTHPEIFRAYGKAVGGGILMYGPPGCGKTYLARATAGEIKAAFISVGINDVLDMWLGNSEKSLHAIFEQARRNTPCVLFFDEVDALAASRSDMRTSVGRHVINQFLAEMDGVKSSNDGVLILAASNAPWHVDSAFRRPGRFDRVLFVPPPDEPSRAATLRVLVKGKPAQSIDFELIAKKTADFSGADLKAVVDLAVEDKIRAAMRGGVPQPLTTRDIASAAARIKPSTRDWFATARNYAIHSNQGGQYDGIAKYLGL